MTTVYCCGAAPTVAAFTRHLRAGRAVVICVGGCASADALEAESRSRKGQR
jgi:hypothetical protein